MRFSIDYIRFTTYRLISIALAALFLIMPLMLWVALSLKVITPLAIVCAALLLALAMLNRNAKCPSCDSRLRVVAPFRGSCQRCGSRLDIVKV